MVDLDTDNLPQHIAIIMDGNGRWAEQRQQNRLLGHRAGVKSARRIVQLCIEKKIEVLTLFAFSSENWRRPHVEVSALMELFGRALKQEVKQLHKQSIRLSFIGDKSRFNHRLQEMMQQAELLTATNQGMRLVIAVDYGGRWDIIKASRSIAQAVADGDIKAQDIDEALFSRYLVLPDLPEPDLFIRTSGEQRISNFLLWQLAYTELYFSTAYWPDFDVIELDKALQFYANRQRRFGHTGQQVERQQHA